MTISRAEMIFLHLLSASIYDKDIDLSLFRDIDDKTWREIASISIKQSVGALVADKALTLPEEYLPQKRLLINFVSHVEQTKSVNMRMIRSLCDMDKLLKEQGYPYILLKGLGNGINYPNPLLRTPGDIDLVLYDKDDYEKSKTWMASLGVEISSESILHYCIKYEGISIEIHKRVSYFGIMKLDKMFGEWEKRVFNAGVFPNADIDGMSVNVLPVEMNAFFIFQHLFRHFLNQGVGLRQVSDWVLFLENHKDDIDREAFAETARRYDLLYPMQVFAQAVVKYLGVDERIFPFEVEAKAKHSDLVMRDILKVGNFGFHRPGMKRPKNKILGMAHGYVVALERVASLGAISPKHMLNLPFSKVVNRLKASLK